MAMRGGFCLLCPREASQVGMGNAQCPGSPFGGLQSGAPFEVGGGSGSISVGSKEAWPRWHSGL